VTPIVDELEDSQQHVGDADGEEKDEQDTTHGTTVAPSAGRCHLSPQNRKARGDSSSGIVGQRIPARFLRLHAAVARLRRAAVG
jgi:hypothetical protein